MKKINSYCMTQIEFHLTFLVILPAPSNHSGPVELCSIHDSVALFCLLLWILLTYPQTNSDKNERSKKGQEEKMFQKFIENGMVVFRKEYQVQFSKRKSNWLSGGKPILLEHKQMVSLSIHSSEGPTFAKI